MDFDKSLYTPAGARIIEMAEEIALQMGFNYFGVEHLLLAICHHPETETHFKDLFGFNALAIHDLVVRKYHMESADAPPTKNTSMAIPTLRLRNVLRMAQECLPLTRRHSINAEALLLGILKEGHSDAAKILDSMDITYEHLLPRFQESSKTP